MLQKALIITLFLSLSMAFASPKHAKKHSSKTATIAPSPISLNMDSMFLQIKDNFDAVVASPNVKSKTAANVNGYFFKNLKELQPLYSFTRVNNKGILQNEVIRLVEKMDVKKQNLSKESWVRQCLKNKREYAGMIKLEESGRYYIVWAAPIIDKDKKGNDVIEGAVQVKVDLWDCFYKYASTVETPFLVRLDRLHLYSNKWKDSIAYKESALTIPGIKKIFVRYPKLAPAPVAITPVPAAVVPAIDSTKIKTTQDSIKAAQSAQTKKAKKSKNAVLAVFILLATLLGAILFKVILTMRQKQATGKIDREDP